MNQRGVSKVNAAAVAGIALLLAVAGYFYYQNEQMLLEQRSQEGVEVPSDSVDPGTIEDPNFDTGEIEDPGIDPGIEAEGP